MLCYCSSLEDVRILLPRFMRNIPVGRFVFVFIQFTEIPQCQLHRDLKRGAQPHAGLLEVGKNRQILFVMSSKFIYLFVNHSPLTSSTLLSLSETHFC